MIKKRYRTIKTQKAKHQGGPGSTGVPNTGAQIRRDTRGRERATAPHRWKALLSSWSRDISQTQDLTPTSLLPFLSVFFKSS